MATEIRKYVTIVEETRREIGEVVDPPTRQCAAIAVIKNPYAGRYSKDLTELEEAGAELGGLLVARAVAALGIDPAEIHSYGKAAIVGEAGEREHAAAILHPRLGRPIREVIGPAHAIIPSAKKIGGPGAAIDCPLHFKDDEWRFSHFDAMEVSLPDAPRADEIVVILALTDAGRPLHRVGEDVQIADVMAGTD
jgi:Amino acid synthesis